MEFRKRANLRSQRRKIHSTVNYNSIFIMKKYSKPFIFSVAIETEGVIASSGGKTLPTNPGAPGVGEEEELTRQKGNPIWDQD